MKNEWHYYGKCPCGHRELTFFKSLFYIKRIDCPNCGRLLKEWELVKGRFVCKVVWWKPWTWFDSYWEEIKFTGGCSHQCGRCCTNI